ncbi:hypothetical protein KC344_g21 [Hortaea werneckii]|nr:hypothetical protein KC344_g21 [Hortaea werneckii]
MSQQQQLEEEVVVGGKAGRRVDQMRRCHGAKPLLDTSSLCPGLCCTSPSYGVHEADQTRRGTCYHQGLSPTTWPDNDLRRSAVKRVAKGENRRPSMTEELGTFRSFQYARAICLASRSTA